MNITRKDSLELAECLLETIVQEGIYTYWVPFHNVDIPFGTCIDIFKTFIKNPEQQSIQISVKEKKEIKKS